MTFGIIYQVKCHVESDKMKHADWNMNVWKTLFLVVDTWNTEYGVQTNQKYVNVNLY